MATISATIHPSSLGFRTRIEVIIPQFPIPTMSKDSPFYSEPLPKPDKILYLLHGLSDDATAWVRHTDIEAYAEEKGYVVIMPEVQRSFYSDMKHGSQYFTYITEELPKICEELFNIKHKRDKTFIAGLSMGGYGAVKCGLSRPDFYAACAGFSGVLDINSIIPIAEKGWFRELYAIIEQGSAMPDNADLFKLSEKMSKLPANEQSRVLFTCGDEDFLVVDGNRRLDKHMQTLPIDFEYREWAGVHDWKFWEDSLLMAFDFFEKEK